MGFVIQSIKDTWVAVSCVDELAPLQFNEKKKKKKSSSKIYLIRKRCILIDLK